MYDSLSAFFSYGVQPAFENYILATQQGVIGDGSLLRPARAAAELLYHFGEHYRAMQDPTFTYSHIKALCPSYATLGNVVDAAKHHTLTKHSPTISQANQISEALVITLYQDEGGTYLHNQVMVLVQLNNGTDVDLLELLGSVYDFWARQINQAGVLNPIMGYTHVGTQRVSRQLAATGNTRLNGHTGVPFSVRVVYRRYDYATGTFDYTPIAATLTPVNEPDNILWRSTD